MERKTKIVKVLVIAFCFLSVSTFTPTIQARVENAAFKNFIGRSIEHGVDSAGNPCLNLTTLKHLHQIMRIPFKLDNYTLYKLLYLFFFSERPLTALTYVTLFGTLYIISYRIFRLLEFDVMESIKSAGLAAGYFSLFPLLYVLEILLTWSVSLVFYVTDEEGLPIDNATICAVPSRGPLPGIDPYIAEKDDEPGVYVIPSNIGTPLPISTQPPGVYNYTVTAPGYQNFTGQTDDIPPGGIEYVHVILKRAE
mgnify:CR=1 FL=1